MEVTSNFKDQERLYGSRSSKSDPEKQVGFKRAEEEGKEIPGRGKSTHQGIGLGGAECLEETEQFRFVEA